MTDWQPVPPADPAEQRVPHLGRLEPPLRWLGGCQNQWPPVVPETITRVLVRPPFTDGSVAEGRARADEVADRAEHLLVVTAAGDPVPGLVACAALLDLEPVRVVGTQTPDFARLTVSVRDALPRAREHRTDPAALLDHIDPAVAHVTGLLAQAGARRTPVVLDSSPVVAAGALVAHRLVPGARTWWLAAQTPPSPAVQAAYRELRLTPLLDLDLDGPAAAEIALVVLHRAVELLAYD